MSNRTLSTLSWPSIESQPEDVRGLIENERDNLIVSAFRVQDQSVIVSRYGDDCWQLGGLPTNTSESRRQLNYQRVPAAFRAVMKAVVYRYMRRGRELQRKPKPATVINFFSLAITFLRYLESLKIDRFGAVNLIVFSTYTDQHLAARKFQNRPLSQSTFLLHFHAIEALYELSQYTHDPLPEHPWPSTSSKAMAKMTGSSAPHKLSRKTPLMSDAVFCTIFEKANLQVQNGVTLLDLRDAVAALDTKYKGAALSTIVCAKKSKLTAMGWKGGLSAFNKALLDLRTACYIVLASTTGCRNHELSNVHSGSHNRTEDDEGKIFHWMRSKSEKTDAGMCDWMIPDAAVRSLRVMERWAEPYQAMIAEEIRARRKVDPLDLEIFHAQKHRHALFLGACGKKGNRVRTLSLTSLNRSLNEFAKDAGIDWYFASHQFRRKFANYVAHSRFGDLRYLRVHFAHWSMDMTLGYAMDEDWGGHLDLELYDEIQAEFEDIKLGTVDVWLREESLGGGYGGSLKRWQRDPTTLAIFKDHRTMVISIADSTAIRSNGHAWCTADNDGCVGNTLERTRCGGCNHSVIGPGHLGIYRQLYNNLKELMDCNDIGENGHKRVLRELERCRDVIVQLGYDPESIAA